MSSAHLQARDLLVSLDRSQGRSITRQLEAQLRTAIRSGMLAPGTNLPSTRALAEDLAVSRGVVLRAYSQLSAEGYLDLRPGAKPRVRRVAEPEQSDARDETAVMAPSLEVPVRYDLRPHVPEVGRFPRQAWLRSLRHALRTASDADLGYTDPRGMEQLRTEIAQYLARARGVVVRTDQVVVTAGSTHALSLICRTLARRGATRIGFENPSHRLLYAVAERAGLMVVGVSVDADGVLVDELRRADVSAVLVSPAHQFPTGVALHPERRTGLADWATRVDGLIIEDDYDAEFRYDRAPIAALQGLAPDRVIYIGSTGKSLLPSMRLGWAVLPPDLADPIAMELLQSVLQLPAIEQLALADFIARGEFERHLRRMRTIYRRRRDALTSALARELPRVRVGGIAAGLHVVVQLSSQLAEAVACDAIRARGLAIESLSQHSLPGSDGPYGLLVGYGAISEPAIPHAVHLLAEVLRSEFGKSSS